MKYTIKFTIIQVLSLFCLTASAQVYNLSKLNNNRNLLHIQTGLENSVNYGVGYSRVFSSGHIPATAQVSVSVPSGNDLFDDYKIKAGSSQRWLQRGGFGLGTTMQAVYRKRVNDYSNMSNVGAELSATAGWYRSRFFLAGELTFDKAILTHIEHSARYKESYPNVQDGWFEPTTGGNFYYGIQAGYSFRKSDLTLRMGNSRTEDFKNTPLIPFYAALGCNIRL